MDYLWPKFRENEPEAPQREAEALAWARAAGLPVPEVIAADPTGAVAGVPALLLELVPGRAQSSPPIQALAELHATVHAVRRVRHRVRAAHRL